MAPLDTMGSSMKQDLELIARHRVFFGHHSVGRDILEGVARLAAENDVDVALDEGPVGENGKPLDKIADFEEAVLSQDADLAVVKLCYVDFQPRTDVVALLKRYEQAVGRIKRAKPRTRVLHVTPPLHVRQIDVKSKLNRKLSRLVWEDEANLKRLEFAERLKGLFPKDPVFDLATMQSTKPDGTREIHLVGDRQVPMLWPGWSTDGGHFNERGKEQAARAFVAAMAAAVRR